MVTIEPNWQAKKIEAAKHYQDLIGRAGINNLQFVSREGKTITLMDGREVREFVSCSYLGLEIHPRLVRAAKEALDIYGAQFAAARTRIRPVLHDELECALSNIFGGTYITTFNAVTSCHLAVFPLLACGRLPGFKFKREPIFLLDRTAHASIQLNRGLLEQFGRVVRTDCRDLNLLEDVITSARRENRQPIVISDSVGSMGGLFPVREILRLTAEYGAYAYFDDAHGTSVFSKNGCGYVLDETMDGALPANAILVGSLSKAFGAHGGFVATSGRDTSEFIRRYGSTFVFGGPPSLPGLASCMASGSLHADGSVRNLQNKLYGNLLFFDKLFVGTINHGTQSPIRGIMIGDEDRAIEIATRLLACGFAVTTAIFPTVAKGKAILRRAISSLHDHDNMREMRNSYEECIA